MARHAQPLADIRPKRRAASSRRRRCGVHWDCPGGRCRGRELGSGADNSGIRRERLALFGNDRRRGGGRREGERTSSAVVRAELGPRDDACRGGADHSPIRLRRSGRGAGPSLGDAAGGIAGNAGWRAGGHGAAASALAAGSPPRAASQAPALIEGPAGGTSLIACGESAGWPRAVLLRRSATRGAVRRAQFEEGRDSTGQGAGSQPGVARRRKVQQKADRRWVGPRARSQARVKRCGKSAPSSGATPADRQTPPGARPSRDRTARPMIPGRPLRWMATPTAAADGQNPAYRPAHRFPLPRVTPCEPVDE